MLFTKIILRIYKIYNLLIFISATKDMDIFCVLNLCHRQVHEQSLILGVWIVFLRCSIYAYMFLV